MRHDPLYSQLWTSLPSTQRRALLTVLREGGTSLASAAVTRRAGMGVTTLQRAVQALANKQIVREEQTRGAAHLRIEDPLFATWIRLIVRD
jgi:DNA-binding GntR family transcriptional regulator